MRIFVLFDGVGLMVKSVELLPGSSTAEPVVRISSANTHNSAYQRRLVEIDIKGRIIWFGRRLSRKCSAREAGSGQHKIKHAEDEAKGRQGRADEKIS